MKKDSAPDVPVPAVAPVEPPPEPNPWVVFAQKLADAKKSLAEIDAACHKLAEKTGNEFHS